MTRAPQAYRQSAVDAESLRARENETPFTRRMRQICDEAPRRCRGYTPVGLRLMIDRCGGDFVRSAKWMLHRYGGQSGLDRFAPCGAADISMEAVVLEEPWCRLFEPDDLAAARWRLELAQGTAAGTGTRARRTWGGQDSTASFHP